MLAHYYTATGEQLAVSYITPCVLRLNQLSDIFEHIGQHQNQKQQCTIRPTHRREAAVDRFREPIPTGRREIQTRYIDFGRRQAGRHATTAQTTISPRSCSDATPVVAASQMRRRKIILAGATADIIHVLSAVLSCAACARRGFPLVHISAAPSTRVTRLDRYKV